MRRFSGGDDELGRRVAACKPEPPDELVERVVRLVDDDTSARPLAAPTGRGVTRSVAEVIPVALSTTSPPATATATTAARR